MKNTYSEGINTAMVCGQTEQHLVAEGTDGTLLHRDLLAPLEELRQTASASGFELSVASGFRSFERQCAIWNAKARGQRPVLDDNGHEIAMNSLSDKDKVYAILRWSALPGASRHHWGTDMDLWDRSAVADSYELKLVPAEYVSGGPFQRFAQWLGSDEVCAKGFFLPYADDQQGIAPEPWHLSYGPLAEAFTEYLSPRLLYSVIDVSNIALKTTVLINLEEIYQRFIACPK